MSDIFKPVQKSDDSISTLREFYKSEEIWGKSDLSLEEIGYIIEANIVNKYLKSVWKIDLGYEDITAEYMKLVVSKARKGRSEAMEVLKAHIESLMGEGAKDRTIMDRLLARNR